MKNSPEVLYLDYDGPLNTVFDSQVLAVCNGLMLQGIKIHYLGYMLAHRLLYDSCSARKSIKSRLGNNFSIRMKFPYMGSLNLWLSAALGLSVMKPFQKSTILLHCRGTLSGRMGLMIKRMRIGHTLVFTDYRGVHSEHFLEYPEALSKLSFNRKLLDFRIRSFHKAEVLCVRKSDYHFAVSRPLMEHFSLNPCTITPCNYEERLFFYDGTYVPGAALNLLYSGGAQNYQCIDEMLKLFSSSKRWSQCNLTIFTHQPSKLVPYLERANLTTDDVEIRRAERKDLRAEFNRFDYGIVLRQPTLVNKVASPTKIPEYLACGLPILHTAAISNFSRFEKNAELGIELSLEKLHDLSYVRILLESLQSKKFTFNRKLISEYAKKHYSLGINLEKIVTAYRARSFAS